MPSVTSTPAATDAMARLATRWRESRVTAGPPLTDANLDEFETRFRFRLPAAFRRYLLTVNGMAIGDWDSDLIHFWTLDEMAEHLSDPALVARFPFVPFADYSLNIWVWALPLAPGGAPSDSVCTFGPPLAFCADSFADFVSKYSSGEDVAPKVLTPREGQLHWHHGA